MFNKFLLFKIAELQPIIETTHGKVRGHKIITPYNDSYYAFERIPYAKPPIGDLRFKSPVSVDPWNEILDGTQRAPLCLQYNRYEKKNIGNEDCLYLNIHVKKLKSDKPLPVMVYIHGGGFNTGDATRHEWGPDYFMMNEVIYISIASRMGIFGYLSFDDPNVGVPGNNGLKDIVLALKWIKDNCLNFNGDPNNITLFGHSSGGVATHILMLSERAKGLFHKAIIMAGFSVQLTKIPNLPYRLAKHLGYEGENIDKDVFKFISTMDGQKLVGFHFWTPEELQRGFMYAFMASIETYESPDSIITKDPLDLLPTAWSNNIPIMLGATSMESLIQYKFLKQNPNIFEIYRTHPEYLLPRDLQGKCDIDTQKRLARKIIQVYFGDKEINEENIFCLIEIISYNFIYHSIHRLLLARGRDKAAPAYLYRFDFDSPTFNLYRIKHNGPDLRGVGHVDELSYIFYMKSSFKLDTNSAEFKTILRMVNLWTAFAENSDPNNDFIKPIIWEPVDNTGQRKCLNISYDIKFIESPEERLCREWDALYEECGMRLY